MRGCIPKGSSQAGSPAHDQFGDSAQGIESFNRLAAADNGIVAFNPRSPLEPGDILSRGLPS